MDGSVDVVIPVDADVAGALDEPGKRAIAGLVVSRMLRPAGNDEIMSARPITLRSSHEVSAGR